MVKKSLKINTLLSAANTMFSVLFPLITFKYASNVLGVTNLGTVNFGTSIISYFSLIAALGIPTFAIREGSRIRNNNIKFERFVNEIFTINMITTLVSYLLLFTIILLIPKFYDLRYLLIIQSLIIAFATVGREWIYSIYEDFLFITIRNLIFQIISLVLMFIFVQDNNDYYIYAFIIVLSSAGSNLMNFLYSRKYSNIKLIFKRGLSKYLKPILIIFSNSVASIIYVNSDITILGLMVGEYYVGIYSASTKVYFALKMILATVLLVSLPRLSSYIAEKREIEYNNVLNKIINVLIVILLPIIVGLNIFSNEAILLLSDSSYLDAISSLRILSIALLFSTFASFISTSIFLPNKKEINILKATLIGAIINIVLNLIFIPMFKQNGAAATTLLSEVIVFIIGIYYMKNMNNIFLSIKSIGKNLVTSILGCVIIVLIAFLVKSLITNMIVYTIITIICSILAYGLLLLLFKNEIAGEILKAFINKIK